MLGTGSPSAIVLRAYQTVPVPDTDKKRGNTNTVDDRAPVRDAVSQPAFMSPFRQNRFPSVRRCGGGSHVKNSTDFSGGLAGAGTMRSGIASCGELAGRA